MKEDFDTAMTAILTWEGGKVDDPSDPGVRTNEGVTATVWKAYRANNSQALPADVFDMADADRDAIYRLQYADKIKFDALPGGVDLALLDASVHSGITQAVKWAQRALPGFDGKVDGVLGEATFAAIQAADANALIIGICQRRMEFLRALKTFSRFGKGWTARVTQVQKLATAMASGVAMAPAPIVTENPGVRAGIEDAKTIPPGSPGAGVAGLGAASATAAGVLQATKDQVGKLATIPHMADAVAGVQAWIDHGMVLLGFGGFVVATIGGAWFAWNRSRAAKLRDALDLPQPKGA